MVVTGPAIAAIALGLLIVRKGATAAAPVIVPKAAIGPEPEIVPRVAAVVPRVAAVTVQPPPTGPANLRPAAPAVADATAHWVASPAADVAPTLRPHAAR